MEYKNYLILTEFDREGIKVTAIPDEGETIRRRFIFYTEQEAIELTKQLIDEQID